MNEDNMKLINLVVAAALLVVYPPLFVLAVAVDLLANLLRAAWRVPQCALYRRPMPTSFWPRPFWTEPLQRRWYDCWQANNQASYGIDIGWHRWISPRTSRTSYAARPSFGSHGGVGVGADFATRRDPGSTFYSHGRGGKADSAARPGAGAGFFMGSSSNDKQAKQTGAGRLPNKGRSSIAQRPGKSFDPTVVRDGLGAAARSIQAHSSTQDRVQSVARRPERHDKTGSNELSGMGLQPVGWSNQTGISGPRTHIDLLACAAVCSL